MSRENCIFCRIVRKEIPASIVYEDSKVIAFMDIRPLSDGHTLVIPKKHYDTVYEIPDNQNASIHKAVKRVAIAVKKATAADGITIIQQNEKAAGQEIPHMHVHVIPRYVGQNLARSSDIPLASRNKLAHFSMRIAHYL